MHVQVNKTHLVLQYILVVIMILVLLTLRFFRILPSSASPLAVSKTMTICRVRQLVRNELIYELINKPNQRQRTDRNAPQTDQTN